jgi:hypothetical protein
MSDAHDHDHAGHQESASMASRVGALVATLQAKGIVTEGELDGAVEAFLSSTQRAGGPALVARAFWPTRTAPSTSSAST